VDQADRGASINLMQMGVQTVNSDAADFLRRVDDQFAMIVVDLHDNSEKVWAELWPLLGDHVESDGSILLYNSHLWQQPYWHEEIGLRWITEASPAGWTTEVFPEPAPGMVICRRTGRNAAPSEDMPDDDDPVKTRVATTLTATLVARFADRHAELQQAGREATELLAAAAGYKAALDTTRGEIDAAQAAQHAELQHAGREAAELLAAAAGYKAALDTARSEINAARAALMEWLNNAKSDLEAEQRTAALLAVALSTIEERERQIDHPNSELASLREERAAFEMSVQTQLEELHQRVGTLVTGAETWLIPTLAKHAAALQRCRRRLGPIRFWRTGNRGGNA
jgi:hypothetical protein